MGVDAHYVGMAYALRSYPFPFQLGGKMRVIRNKSIKRNFLLMSGQGNFWTRTK